MIKQKDCILSPAGGGKYFDIKAISGGGGLKCFYFQSNSQENHEQDFILFKTSSSVKRRTVNPIASRSVCFFLSLEYCFVPVMGEAINFNDQH